MQARVCLQLLSTHASQRLFSVLVSSYLRCDAETMQVRADPRSVVAPNIVQSEKVGTGFHPETTILCQSRENQPNM
jgi:hypothetical protein